MFFWFSISIAPRDLSFGQVEPGLHVLEMWLRISVKSLLTRKACKDSVCIFHDYPILWRISPVCAPALVQRFQSFPVALIPESVQEVNALYIFLNSLISPALWSDVSVKKKEKNILERICALTSVIIAFCLSSFENSRNPSLQLTCGRQTFQW